MKKRKKTVFTVTYMQFKKIIIVILLCMTTNGFSQKNGLKSFQLEWNMAGEMITANGMKLKVPLVVGNFIDEKGLPVYASNWEVKANSNVSAYQLKNINYENVDSKDLEGISIGNIPTELKSEFIISKAGNRFLASLVVTPLIKEGNSIKKIISFEIAYELKAFQNKQQASLVEDSVLANGTWYKFSINKTGVFKIDATLLSDIGINISGVDPRNIKIYGNGGAMLPYLNSDFRYENLQENKIYVEGEADGVFNDTDYILFYGKGPHDWKTASENSISHRNNIFSDESYYFISVDNGVGKRISNETVVTESATDQIVNFKDYQFLEEDKKNLFGAGQQWFGDSFGTTNVRSYSFNFNNIDVSKDVKIRARGVAQSSSASSMLVKVNNVTAFNLNYSAISNGAFTKASAILGQQNMPLTSPVLNVEISYDNGGNPSADAHLDYIEIIGDKLLKADGSQFSFRNFKSQEVNKVLEYTISNKDNVDMLWDVTDFLNPKIIENQNPTAANYSFKAKSGKLNEYVVLNNSDFYVPTALENSQVLNQNLHSLRDIEYLLITKTELMPQAQRIADYHTNASGMSTKVVDLKEIYNEFGSGSKDITAIRDFVRFLYDNASSSDKKIKYLCLFGDSSYDYKDRLPGNNNIVPVFLAETSFSLVYSYVTDDYYGMMDAGEGLLKITDKQDVATGRILVSDEQQAKTVVDKILNYYNKVSLGNWRNELTLMADDLGNASEFVLQEQMEFIADMIKANKPQYNIKKLYADAFKQVKSSGGDRYPDVNLGLSNAIDKGSLIVDYFGHGGESGLGAERLLEISDIQSWNNFDNLTLFITVTCDFSRFDNPARITAGEEMVLSRNGGAANLISTTREVFINYGRSFNLSLIPKLLDFNNENYSIAQALMHTKNDTPSFSGQHHFIFSLGDPAMKLGTPNPNIKITKINDKDISVKRDTLKALSKIKLEGVVTNNSGSILTDFNGVLSTSIFDKPIDRKTLDNDGFGLVMTFDVQDSKIFKGKTEVKNGNFSIEFIVPKDIKVAYGNSKISLYAENSKISKGGFDIETVIGGINEDAEDDTEGPVISLFMNDETFVDGGNTNASPNLIAKFFDTNGINTSVGAIGHSIIGILDGDESNPIQLNEFYDTEIGDYMNGNLSYILRNLEPGLHTIKIKAWDTYNNSSEKTLNFKVLESGNFELENVLNYPNPFINYTEFWFNHNRPNESLDVKIYIFSVSGKLVKSINQLVQTAGSLSRSITWDGKDDFGAKVGKGVYVYKIIVKSNDTGAVAEKFEKLVLLQ